MTRFGGFENITHTYSGPTRLRFLVFLQFEWVTGTRLTEGKLVATSEPLNIFTTPDELVVSFFFHPSSLLTSFYLSSFHGAVLFDIRRRRNVRGHLGSYYETCNIHVWLINNLTDFSFVFFSSFLSTFILFPLIVSQYTFFFFFWDTFVSQSEKENIYRYHLKFHWIKRPPYLRV